MTTAVTGEQELCWPGNVGEVKLGVNSVDIGAVQVDVRSSGAEVF